VTHLNQAQPDRTFGPKQNAFVYKIPGKNQDIGTQMAFTMPEDDYDDCCDDDDDIYAKDDKADDFRNFVSLTSSIWTSYGGPQTGLRKLGKIITSLSSTTLKRQLHSVRKALGTSSQLLIMEMYLQRFT
jgi:hypothetical protein